MGSHLLRSVGALVAALIAAPIAMLFFFFTSLIWIPITTCSACIQLTSCEDVDEASTMQQRARVGLIAVPRAILRVSYYVVLVPLFFLVILVGSLLNVLASPFVGFFLGGREAAIGFNSHEPAGWSGCGGENVSGACSGLSSLLVELWAARGLWTQVSASASPPSFEDAVAMEGTVLKETVAPMTTSKYAVLKGSTLAWYESRRAYCSLERAQGEEVLSGATLARHDGWVLSGKQRLCISCPRGSVTLVFPKLGPPPKGGYMAAAGDEDELGRWERALQAAIDAVAPKPEPAAML